MTQILQQAKTLNFAVLHSWNVFLFLSALPSLVSGVVYIFMPETPKFLMTRGENEKAMEVLSMVYSINTGRPRKCYPVRLRTHKVSRKNKPRFQVKSLLQERIQSNEAGTSKLHQAFKQALHIFSEKYRWQMVLICSIQFGLVIG